MSLIKSRLLIPVVNFINEGKERSVKAKKNILWGILIRGIGILTSLVLVPLTIHYVNADQYGIWLTLSSIVSWFAFFDIGLTQGLRNKFAEARAKEDDELAQIFVSTTYAVLGIIFFLVWLAFILINPLLDWSVILNTPENTAGELGLLSIIIFTYFCIQFVIKIINTILIADQQPAGAALIGVIGQVVSLTLVAILVKTTEGSLIYLGLALCAAPIIVLSAANFYFFNGKYKRYRPQLGKVNFKYGRNLFNLGMTFFVIQIAAVIQYQTANIIIAQNFDASRVTSYNIVYKYFHLLTMAFTIFVTPFWSACTEAYLNNDINWIKSSIRNYNILTGLFFVAGLIMLLFSNDIYDLWIGKNTVDINRTLSFWGFAYTILIIFGNKYVMFLNGISALRIQFISSLITPVLYIAIALLMIRYWELGVYAVFIALIIASLNSIVIAPIQYYQIIYKNKKGIWTK